MSDAPTDNQSENFVIAYFDGEKYHLEQCVDGKYTSEVSVSESYISGTFMRIVHDHRVVLEIVRMNVDERMQAILDGKQDAFSATIELAQTIIEMAQEQARLKEHVRLLELWTEIPEEE